MSLCVSLNLTEVQQLFGEKTGGDFERNQTMSWILYLVPSPPWRVFQTLCSWCLQVGKTERERGSIFVVHGASLKALVEPDVVAS